MSPCYFWHEPTEEVQVLECATEEAETYLEKVWHWTLVALKPEHIEALCAGKMLGAMMKNMQYLWSRIPVHYCTR